MTLQSSTIPAERIIVMMPNWIGDAVMATPFLRALRDLYPNAHIAALARPLVAPVLAGLPFINDLQLLDKSHPEIARRYLRSNRFDLGILLPNSFRSAWLLFRGHVKHRLGYAREFRSPFLTHRLAPKLRTSTQKNIDHAKQLAIRQISQQLGHPASPSIGSPFEPTPTIEYYLQLAEYLGASSPSKTMQLEVTPNEKSEAEQALAQLGITTNEIENQKSKIGGGENFAILIPGANFGSSKCWPPERFAQIADRLMDKHGDFNLQVLLAGSPAEIPIIDAILAHSLLCPNGGGIGRLHALPKLNGNRGVSLGALKEIVRRSKLMLCNDTGPRHFAAAFNIPTITLFGPTDPRWAETYSPHEKILRTDVPCGPCQLKKCPIDHRCMKSLTTDTVLTTLADLWQNAPATNFTNFTN